MKKTCGYTSSSFFVILQGLFPDDQWSVRQWVLVSRGLRWSRVRARTLPSGKAEWWPDTALLTRAPWTTLLSPPPLSSLPSSPCLFLSPRPVCSSLPLTVIKRPFPAGSPRIRVLRELPQFLFTLLCYIWWLGFNFCLCWCSKILSVVAMGNKFRILFEFLKYSLYLAMKWMPLLGNGQHGEPFSQNQRKLTFCLCRAWHACAPIQGLV